MNLVFIDSNSLSIAMSRNCKSCENCHCIQNKDEKAKFQNFDNITLDSKSITFRKSVVFVESPNVIIDCENDCG